MDKVFNILIFSLSVIVCFGQSELKGTWILQSYTVDNGKKFDVDDGGFLMEIITFDKKGRYVKQNYEGEFLMKLKYSFVDGKLTYTDKNGTEIRSKHFRKKTEKGEYEKVERSDEIRFRSKNSDYTRKVRVVGSYLFIDEVFDNTTVLWKYRRR